MCLRPSKNPGGGSETFDATERFLLGWMRTNVQAQQLDLWSGGAKIGNKSLITLSHFVMSTATDLRQCSTHLLD